MAEPSLPPLPPEPPPPKPAPPTAEKRDDLTVVTTYTSFLPLPSNNMIPTPMGYEVPMPSFSNWMPPVADMQRPNMMFPPPQINYTNPPPQQHFPFMNQPPPPLPYQMTIPPPCHQHYRVPSQPPPPGVNTDYSVRQEMKNVKSNPIVIVDEDEPHPHLMEGSKCKHNPLRQNNQTIQEAIDSVRKCLKNCDALKNKDPRLSMVDERKKSPERSDTASKLEDRKVKITMNYKPRPVSDAEQISLFEPANEENCSKSKELSDTNKTDYSYTEKNSKIEDIVSKLKGNITTSSYLLPEEAEEYTSQKNSSFDKRNPGDEPYDPFNLSDEIVGSIANPEELVNDSPDNRNGRIQIVALKDSNTKISESEIENINDQINKSFAFILSHSIERKRLTPTSSSIMSRKAEIKNKSDQGEKIASIAKSFLLSQDGQRNKSNNHSELTPPIPTSCTISAENKYDQIACENDTISNEISSMPPSFHNSNALNESQEIPDNSYICSKLERFDSAKPLDIVSNKISLMRFDSLNKKSDNSLRHSSSINAINLSNSRKLQDREDSAYKKCISQISSQNVEVLNKLSDEDLSRYRSENFIDGKNKQTVEHFIEEEGGKGSNEICKIIDAHNKERSGQNEYQSKSSEPPLDLRHSLEKQKESCDVERGRTCINTTKNTSENQPKKMDSKTKEFSFGINVELMGKQDISQSLGKTVFSESKNHNNLERRANPPLSIPTKGELKRFPTPERSIPRSIKVELHHNTEPDETDPSKKNLPKFEEPKENADAKPKEEKHSVSSSKVIESILNDFDESNSVGCDFQPLIKDKTVSDDKAFVVPRTSNLENECDELSRQNHLTDLNTSLKSCLLSSNNTVNKNDLRDQLPNVHLKISPLDVYMDRDEKSGSHMSVESTNSSTEKLTVVEVTSTHYDSKENNQNGNTLKSDKKNTTIRRSKRKTKISKSKTCNDEFNDSHPTKTIKSEPQLSPEENYSETQNKKRAGFINDIPFQNCSSENPFVLKYQKSHNKECKPCPLSRKCKSYISKNLPLSFDLSVDGHLIRRGFKTLRVNLHQLAPQYTTARSSENFTSMVVSSPCPSEVNSDNGGYLDLETEKNSNDGNVAKKQHAIERPKKKVSFDLNVSEIFDDSNTKFSFDGETVNNDSGSTLNYNQLSERRIISEMPVCFDDGLTLGASNKSPTESVKPGEIYKNKIKKSCDNGEIGVSSTGNSSEMTKLNSVSILYQDLANVLVTLRESPLVHMHKRKKAFVKIPYSDEMPEVKILDHSKNTTLLKNNCKKSDLQEMKDDPVKSTETMATEEHCETESDKAKNKSRNDTLKRKVCDNSKAHDSDNDDSVILDKELSDLAKGCLDSDSNVGEDDDSVLNFGIPASDENSFDSEFDLNNKNTFTRTLTRQKPKLTSPQNIKKKFVKRLRSVNLDIELKINKTIHSDSPMEEKEITDNKSGYLKQCNDTVETTPTEINKPTPDIVSEQILSVTKVTQDTHDVEGSDNLPQADGTHLISCSTLPKGEECNGMLQGIRKRQKNKSKKCLVAREGDSEEDLDKVESFVERIVSTSEVSERNHILNSENNVVLDLPESDKQEKQAKNDLLNNDFENSSEKEEQCEKSGSLNFKTTSTVSDAQTETLKPNIGSNVIRIDNTDISLNSQSNNTLESKSCLKRTPGGCDFSPLHQVTKDDSREQKISPLRKTRRTRLSATGKSLHSDSEEKLTQQFHRPIQDNDKPVIRKTRSVSFIECLSSNIGDLKINIQDQIKEDTVMDMENICNKDDNLKTPNIIEEAKDLILCINSKKQNQTKYSEDLKENLTYEPDCADKGGLCSIQKNIHSKCIDELDIEHHMQGNEKLDDSEKEINESIEPEDVSSTTSELARKTRSSQHKTGLLSGNKFKKGINLDSVNDIFTMEIAESSMRMTRSKKNLSDTVEDDNSNPIVSFECEKIDLEFKKGQVEVKNPHPVVRTLSTESFDEPLIIVKNKLLADKNKLISEELVNECVKINTTAENINSTLQNKIVKMKCKSSVADGSNNSSHGNTKEWNVSNDEKNLQGTRSNDNDSKSPNHSADNGFSNLGNNMSFLNISSLSNRYEGSIMNASQNTLNMNQTLFPPVNLQNINSSEIQPKCSNNPKLKESNRKKRDKAEVDAEIKRRLAEIDELEKLARSQHANVLEKISAETCSPNLDLTESVNIDEEDDVVSISSDDSQCTSVSTNDATSTGSKIVEIEKSENITEEPTTTQENLSKKCFTAEDKSEVSISKRCVDKSKVISKKEKGNLIAENSVFNFPPHTTKNVMFEVCKNTLNINEQKPSSDIELDGEVTLSKQIKKNHRNVVSVYQFTESDESELDEEIHSKQKYNHVSKRRIDIKREKSNSNPILLSSKKSCHLEQKSIKKTRCGPVTPEIICKNSSRESSPLSSKDCDPSQDTNEHSDSTASSNIVPEPDSSTSVIGRSINVKTPTDSLKGSIIRPSPQGEDTNSVVSSNNISHESDIIQTSPNPGFKKPLKKSFVNRRRRKRRSYFGKCLISSNNVENTTNDSFEDNNDPAVTQSEEVVSSSVCTIKSPEDKKKRRRRKTVMDLLMEDSMLSVTRDFPMSPNPYMFSSFYKDIDPPNSSKASIVTESSTTELSTKKINEDRNLPLKPDFLAQKLRILEKLKSISRKNRKTRQCRTLVCYNEDSLPESLVESPVGESVPSNSEGGILSQDIPSHINSDENNDEFSLKSLQEPSKVQLNSSLEEGGSDNSIFETLRKAQKPSKVPLKRGRKSKVNKVIKNISESDQLEIHSQTASDACFEENLVKENVSSIDVSKNENSTFEKNQINSNVELSEFDKLLESKPKDASRMKLLYDYDPGSPRSPSEDKSDGAPDDFFNSLPSPRQSSDDDSSINENLNNNELLSPHCLPVQKNSVGNDEILQIHDFKKPEKIMCSILKTKIGKMMPYFGDTSSDDDVDENLPLSIKLTQFNKDEHEYNQPCSEKEDKDCLNMLPERKGTPECKRKRKQSRRSVISTNRDSVRSTRSKSGTFCGEKDVITDVWSEDNKKIDMPEDSHNENSESPVQLRKSNRKLKTTNFLSREACDNSKQIFNEVITNKQENEINHDKCLNPEIVPIPLKRKGRPPKARLLKENILDKEIKKLNHSTSEVKDLCNTGNASNNESCHNLFSPSSRNPSDVKEDNNCNKSIDSPSFSGNKDAINEDAINNEKHSITTINPKILEEANFEPSDTDSTIQKNITLRKTRAKSGKGSLVLESNINEISGTNNFESAFHDDQKEEYSLEDLPLNKRAAREFSTGIGKRCKKENVKLMDKEYVSSKNDCDTQIDGFQELNEDMFLKNKNERDSFVGSFNDLPPPLIRTRARRAKLLTSDSNDLDPPSLETSISTNIDGKKDYSESSVNEINIENTETLSMKDTNLPPRKRGRKPKVVDTRTPEKLDVSEELQEMKNETSTEESHSNKIDDIEEMQPLLRKRGRRGKRKILKNTSHRVILLQKKYSDDESEVDINTQGIVTDDEPDLTGNSDFAPQQDGRKRKRRVIESKDEKKNTPTRQNTSDNHKNELNEENYGDTKKIKTQNSEDDAVIYSECEPSTSRERCKEPSSYAAPSPVNQPFLWNKISAFLNKTTRSVGTQVKVKNMVLKGFETSEPEVSLQSELTLPQVIKTLFEELRFIDSSFSNS